MRHILIVILAILMSSSFFGEICAFQLTGRLYNDPSVMAGEYTSFCQDKDGFLWIGTNRGLIRFDGNSYDLYRHDDAEEGSISDSRILALLCDSKGRLWVATESGLNLYHPDDDSFEVIPIPAQNFNGYIIAIGEQIDGTVTFIVSGVGLYIVSDGADGKSPVAVKYLNRTVEKEFNTIACCRSGKIYLGTSKGDVYSVAPNGSLKAIPVSDNDYIVSLAVEEDDNVLACTLSDIYRIETATGRAVHLASKSKMFINSLSNAANGSVYVATNGNGLKAVDAGLDEVKTVSDIYCPFLNIQTAKMGAAFMTQDGNLWLGCNHQGIVLVPGTRIPFVYNKLSDAYPDFTGGISALGVWQGHVIACIDKGRIGVLTPEGELVRSIVIPEGDKITHIEVVSPSEVWVSVTDSGIWKLDPLTGSIKKLINIPGKFKYIVTAPGLEDEIFVGIHGVGLMRYNVKTGNEKWIPHDWEGGKFTNPFINCLYRTDDGMLWIGTYGGIACYDMVADKLMATDQEPFLNGATFAIVPCLTDNSVWVGTSHGLIHFDPEKGVIQKITTADGLSDNDIRSITRDHKGGKWIATMRGLSYVPVDNDTILSYYGGNGIVETSFHQIRFSRFLKKVFLGSDQGITSFMPDSVPAPGFDSEVKVSGIYINGKRIPQSADQNLKLPYKDNQLTLRLSTMDFRDATNVRYMWRLNQKEAWITGSPGENVINLPHLDPGKYTLEICAIENNVSSPVMKMQILVSSPWYLSFWAKIGYVMILIALVALGLILYKKKKEEEVNEDKIKFFTDVSHDIRTPMTLVMSPLESLMKEDLNPEVRSRLQVMHRNAQRVMDLINQLLDIRKLDKGKMRLSCRKTEIGVFIGEIVDLFNNYASEKKQTLTFNEIDDLGEVWIDRDNFDKILVNLITNAIKYTPEGGKVEVLLSETVDTALGRCMKIEVLDTGIGIDAKTQSRLFEPFYRMRENHAPATMGFGIGLDLCRRLVALHHGVISGRNREDGVKGSVFTVILPLDESYYADSELVVTADEEIMSNKHLAVSGASPAGDLPSRPKPLTAGGKVLVVDDDKELREYISSLLSRYYKVKTASDGAEALKMIADWQPDLVVSDVMMPEMDGLTLLKRLKSNADSTHIPVILLSSKTALADRMAGWDKGADGYLGKPFSTDELEAMVDTLIENRLRMKGKFSGAQDVEGKIEAVNSKGNDEVFMERVLKEINAHIDDSEFNVEKLASEVGVSRAHLHRKMKDLIGMTPSDYLRNIRLKRACELLKKPDIEVTQVAYRIGFTSQPHFSSHFKRYTGYSPSEYRDKFLSET